MKYKIVDTICEIELNQELKEKWAPFETEVPEADIHIKLIQSPLNIYDLDVLNIKDMEYSLKNEESILFSNHDWSYARLYGNESYQLSSLLEIQLYSFLLNKNVRMLHSSLIEYNKEGIMFLGPSGIGKTTQAELWAKYKNAKILNGDMVFIRKPDELYYAYGSPWHGSSPYYLNNKVPLKALILLEQSSENSLVQLSGFQALHALMEQTFLPHWCKEKMDFCLNTMDDVLKTLPVYLLKCKPDEDAVNLTEQLLF